MDTTAGALNWELLGQEPVPGLPDAVQSLADAYRRRSMLALGAAESVATFGRSATTSWAGATAGAFETAVARVGPEVSVMVDAATRVGNELAGFAEVMRSLQSQAADTLAVAADADTARGLAEERLEVLHAQHASLEVAYHAVHESWQAAQADADAALAGGSPDAAELQSHAQWLRIAVNDALNDTALVEAEIASVGSELMDAEARLQAARTDAHRLALEFQSAAASTAAGLQPVAPYALGIFGTATAGAGAAVAPPAGPGAPRPPASRPPAAQASPSASPVTVPRPIPGTGTGATQAAGQPSVAVPDMVRVNSVLAAVRMIGGRPIPVDHVTPSMDVFRQYQRIGLQDVTARGAAMARALGFAGTIGGLGWRPTPTDHSTGLAIDLMTYDDVATGEVLAQFFREHHEELGVTYVIWNGQIASARQDWAWRTYRHPAGRTDATAMHLDHVHVSFDPADNAYACACFGVPA